MATTTTGGRYTPREMQICRHAKKKHHQQQNSCGLDDKDNDDDIGVSVSVHYLHGYNVPLGSALVSDDAVLPVDLLEDARLAVVAGPDHHHGVALFDLQCVLEAFLVGVEGSGEREQREGDSHTETDRQDRQDRQRETIQTGRQTDEQTMTNREGRERR